MTDESQSLSIDYGKLDHASVAKIVRDCIINMHGKMDADGKKVTYAVIARLITKHAAKKFSGSATVTGDAIKTFVNRGYNQRINSNNQTLRYMHDFFTNSLNLLDDEIKAIIVDTINWSILVGNGFEKHHDDDRQMNNAARLSARAFYSWFRFNEKESSRIFSKFANKYVVFRKSVENENLIIKSSLIIGLDEQKKALTATHIHLDRHGVVRQSTGFVMCIVRNIYIILQVEDGDGLELLALREPIQKDFVKMMGFMMSINTDRKILSARIFLERTDEIWEKINPRFKIDALNEYPDRKELIKALLDEKTALTMPKAILTLAFSEPLADNVS